MSGKYQIAETNNFQKSLSKTGDKKLYPKIKHLVYPALCENPFYGQHIKKLKGKFDNIYRFRISSFRLFYTVDDDRKIVFIIEIVKRKDAY
ncbi:MAG: type II toxin-antitoxin system RelE/ParE family toxin [Ignavibacteria bacterium]|nr:type II toxin-antitoxin system RelE/ParE family toxin [Ignavibacteria bacterium]